MEKMIKENILFILLPILAFFGGIYAVYHFGSLAGASQSELTSKKSELETKKSQLEQIKQQKLSSQTQKKKESGSGKVIYEVLGEQFSPEASFGIMFENVLANITNSGIKIRSIDYNYQPVDDKVLLTNMDGYNACELSFVTVGNYTQLQNFFKNITKEKYLTNIYEIYIEPYDKDKTILIAKFKIRLYTKTI